MKKIVFMGTPEFSVPILDSLIKSKEVDVISVVTQPDRKVGRKKIVTPPPVKVKAQEAGITVLQPEKLSGSKELQTVLDSKPDLVITAAYGQYVPTVLLKSPKYKAINVHASLLPKYRGAAPIHYALINGDKETGVTIMYMEKEMDAGDIISQRSLKILPEDTVGTLFDKLSLLGRDLLMDTLPDIFEETIQPVKQNEEDVTLAPMITPEQERMDWTQPAEQLANKVRGLNPFPGAYTKLEGKRFKVWFAEAVETDKMADPGTVIKLSKDQLWVQCGGMTALKLTEVQPFGKPKMSITDYLQGARNHLKEGVKFEDR